MAKICIYKLLVNSIFLTSSLSAETGGSVSLVHSSQTIYRNALGTAGYTISSPGYYTIGEDIPFDAVASSVAITIASSSVILDMNNRTLSLSNTATDVTAIKIDANVHDITIKNGILSGFTKYGLVNDTNTTTTGAYNVIVDHIDITGMPSGATNAIRLIGGGSSGLDIHDWSFSNCRFTENFVDSLCLIYNSNNVSMHDCKINGNTITTYVARAVASGKIIFDNCDLCSNISAASLTCVGLNSCSGSIIKNCLINNNSALTDAYGIYLDAGSGNIVESCKLSALSGNTTYGIYGTNSEQGSTINSCILQNITGIGNAYGIYLYNTYNCIIKNCEELSATTTSSGYGINIAQYSFKTTLAGNKVYSNSTEGIRNDNWETLIYDCVAGANGSATNPSNFTGDFPATTGESNGNFAQGEYGNGLDYVDGKIYIYANAIQQNNGKAAGLIITRPGYYILAEDINYAPASGIPAIDIRTSYVDLDMNNKTIYQTNSQGGVDGIRLNGPAAGVNGVHDITIQNGTLSGFTEFGLYAVGSGAQAYNVTVDHLDITGMPSGSALYLLGSISGEIHDWTFTHCTLTKNISGQCWILNNCANILMDQCKINSNTAGNVFYGNTIGNVSLKNCEFCNNSYSGGVGLAVTFGVASGCIVDGCILNNNNSTGDFTGMYLVQTTGCIVRNCTIDNNYSSSGIAYGVRFAGDKGSLFELSKISSLSGTTTAWGIYGELSEGTKINNCLMQNITSTSQNSYGIYLDSTKNWQINNCDLLSTSTATVSKLGYGIYVSSNAQKSTLIGDKVYACSTYGIWNDSSTTLIYDCTAGGNGAATNPTNFAGSYPAITSESNGNFAQGEYGNGLDYVDGRIYIYKSAIEKTFPAQPGLTIGAPGHYILAENVDFSPSGSTLSAITINSSFVTLDMNNHAIYQTDSTANVDGISISNTGLHDIAIKNGTLSGFTRYGLVNNASSGTGAYNVTVDNLDITGMPSGAIYALALISTSTVTVDIHDWKISNCDINENRVSDSVHMEYCNSILLNNCKVNGNIATGRMVYGTNVGKIFLKDCDISSNTSISVVLLNPSFGCIIDGCTINYNSSFSSNEGISVTAATTGGATIKNCILSKNSAGAGASDGIVIGGFGPVVESCQVNHSVGTGSSRGIYVASNAGVVRNCSVSFINDVSSSVSTVTTYGILIGGDYNFIENCEVTRIESDNTTGNESGIGIFLSNAAMRNVVYHCKATSNLSYGFYDTILTNSNATTGCIAAVNGAPGITNYGGVLASGVNISKIGAVSAVATYGTDNISVAV